MNVAAPLMSGVEQLEALTFVDWWPCDEQTLKEQRPGLQQPVLLGCRP